MVKALRHPGGAIKAAFAWPFLLDNNQDAASVFCINVLCINVLVMEDAANVFCINRQLMYCSPNASDSCFRPTAA